MAYREHINKKAVTVMLISSLPKTKAQEDALRRARQLSDFKWTPIRDVPSYTRTEGNIIFRAGEELTGLPYSSVEREDRFITENVSFESFLSSIPNPYSKLYQVGHGEYGTANFGVVCNGFVRYALGIQRRVGTKCFMSIPGMNTVAKREEYTVDDIELLDVLYAYGSGKNHVILITDILRNEAGKIVQLELSEATRPLCVRRLYSVEKFYEIAKPYDLCRYAYIENIPRLDEAEDDMLWNSHIEKVTPRITVDNGNRSNYLEGDEVLLSVSSDKSDVVELFCGDELHSSRQVGASAIISLELKRGYYTARLKEDGSEVHFCVNKASVEHSVDNNIITVSADPCDRDSEIVYMDFRCKGGRMAPMVSYEELSDEEKQSGRFSRVIPENAENFKVYYKNKYGIWTHRMTKIF